jgi:exodeoxyribonuclease VII large subunit
VPVITGIGHDIDRAVSDEAAAVATKTPSAAGEWLVGRVMEFANRIAVARHTIRSEADAALQRQRQVLRHAAADVGASATTLRRRRDALENIRLDVAHSSRNLIERRRSELHTLGEWFEVVDVEQTLRRGFAIVTGAERGQVIRSVDGASPGDVLVLRFADGTVRVTVEDD